MTCKCGSDRIASVGAKCDDRCFFAYGEKERSDYVPSSVGIGEGDYIEIDYCLDCGQIQGNFPIDEEDVEEVFK